MIKIRVMKPFSFAYQGIRLVHYAPGLHEVSARCAEVALAEGWAKPAPKTGKAKKTKTTKKGKTA